MAIDGTNRGRPTILTPEIQEAICAAISKGMAVTSAGALAGVSSSTVNRWVQQGKEAEENNVESPLRDFWEAIARAKADFQHNALTKIWEMVDEADEKTGKRDPRPLQWLLERREPDDFGEKKRTEISGPDGGPVVMTFADLVKSASEGGNS